MSTRLTEEFRSACAIGPCLEVAASFRPASSCVAGIDCVKVAREVEAVKIRKTTDSNMVIEVTPDEWLAFIKGVKEGEFDLA